MEIMRKLILFCAVIIFIVYTVQGLFYGSNRRNWALHGHAVQSSSKSAATEAQNVVDGVITNNVAGGSCSETLPSEDPWLAVSPQEKLMIEEILIVNRGDDFDMQLGNLYIEVQHADSKVQNMSFCYYYNSYLLPGAAKYFRCPTPLPGKSVKIIMKGTNKTLSVCEVKIFGSPIQSVIEKNWAYRMPAHQSSTRDGRGAVLAVDGAYHKYNVGIVCTMTSQNDMSPWWEVDLQQTIMVTAVSVYSHGDCCGNLLRHFYILVISEYISELCWYQSSLLKYSDELECKRAIRGRYVRIQKDVLEINEDALSLCEVQVKGWKTADAIDNYWMKRDNRARGKVTSQSSVHELGGSNLTVDGHTYNTWASRSCSMTALDDFNPWWKVELGWMFIESVLVYFPVDTLLYSDNWAKGTTVLGENDHWRTCTYDAVLERVHGRNRWTMVDLQQTILVIEVELTNSARPSNRTSVEILLFENEASPPVCYEGPVQSGAVTFVCKTICKGRYVRVTELYDMINLDDQLVCQIKVKGRLLGPLNRKWYSEDPDNWARGKPATQSSTAFHKTADFAVDGDSNCPYGTHTHTSLDDIYPWWMVDLQKTILVTDVKISLAQDCCGTGFNLSNVYIEVLNSGDLTVSGVCYHERSTIVHTTLITCVQPLEGQYVQIRKDGPVKADDVLVLCEVEVKGKEIGTEYANLARGMVALQSSTNGNHLASMAVDGNYDCSAVGTFTQTVPAEDKQPWWMVDLKNTVLVKSVKIVNSQYCCRRQLHDLSIEVLQSRNEASPQICHYQTLPIEEQSTISCNPPLIGRYVRIRKNGPLEKNAVLSLCEVEVNGDQIDTDSVNWAKGKSASQSSTSSHSHKVAAFAVDGNYDCMKNGSYTETALSDEHPWWMVDLVNGLLVDKVKLFNRQDCCGYRLRNFHIEVLKSKDDSSPSVCHFQKHPVGESAEYTCDPPLEGRYVRIRKNNTLPHSGILTLCEVEVYGEKIKTVVDKNWAKGKHATQSSTHLKQGADLATDGNTNCTGVSSWSQTHASDRHPWWIVDLQQTIAISAVTIYTCPQTCHIHLQDFYIEVLQYWEDISPAPCHFQLLQVTKATKFPCQPAPRGRFVRIRKDNTSHSTSVLTLCEVEVNGWEIAYSKNWAWKKPVLQSSISANTNSKQAVDGIYNCSLSTSYTETLPTDKYPWLVVDLDATIYVEDIILYNRGDCCQHHLRNFFIEVLRSFNETSPAICHYQTQAVNASGVFHCHPAIKGEYVRIRKVGPVPKEEVLALCEVEVYGYYDEIIVPNLKVQVDDKVSCGQMMKRHNPGDVTEFTCPKNTYGHSLTITKNSGYWGDILWLCEVQVYGAGKDRNWALGKKAYIEDTDGNFINRFPYKHVVDGDVSNGFNTSACPMFHAKHSASLVVDLQEAHLYVEKVVYITAVGKGAPTTLRNVKIVLHDVLKRNHNDRSCSPHSKDFRPGYSIAVTCTGNEKTRLANRVILLNDPQARSILVCEVEIYGKLAFFEKVPSK